MSQFVEQISSHQVFSELEEVTKVLELARDACSGEQGPLDHWDRASAIAAYVRRSLDQADPLLLVPETLARVASSLQQAKNEISGFVSNKNIAHWNNAQAQLNSSLAQLAALPRQTSDGIEGMKESASSYRTAISKWLDAIKADGEEISHLQANLLKRIDETTSDINVQKQRLDTAIATFQQQFSEAQQARQSEFSTAEQVRAQAAVNSENERKESFEEAEEARAVADEKAASEALQRHNELVLQLTNNGDTIIAALEQQRTHAEKLIGIITDTGMAYGYQKNANEEKQEATVWKMVASGSLGLWIVVGVVFLALTYDKDLTWPTVARQFLISTPFILLSGFAALQVSRHQRYERRLRQAELELASIDPFLATLKDEERNAVKREFATRYFGQREEDRKHEVTEPKLLELAGTLAKTIQEFQHALKKS